MAEPDQPKKETVRIQLPHPPVTKPSEPGVKPHETVGSSCRFVKPALRLFPLPRRHRREYFFNELFTAAETANCLASVIGFRASSSDSTLFRTEKGDRAHSRDARIVALVSKKDSAADRDAESCFTKSADRDSTGREKLNARVLDASRYVRIDFDYPDLDVFFLAMENSAVITLNESNFDRELTQDDKPMIVDFWAEWCGPCKMIAPLLDEIAREKAGTLKIAKVNVDENQSLSPSTIFARFRRCFFSRTANCAIRSSALRARRICSAGWKHWLREFSRGRKFQMN